MDAETTENESVDPGDANTEKDNVDTNLEKKNVSTNLEKENVHINTEKKSSNVLIEKVNDEKPTDNEAIDINIEQDTNIEKVSGDINTEQEVSSAELKTAYTSNNEEDGKMVQSVMSEMSTNARNLFDDVDEDTERTQTGVTRTTFDTMASASVTDFNDSTLTRNQRCTLFNMGVHDEEFEGYITISEPTVEEEEESDDIFGYLEGFSRADQAVPAPSLVILERQANEAELYKLCEQQVQTRRKYGFLNKKLSEYFKKKKMDRVFEDVAPDLHNSLFEKYERKIEEFNDIYNEWIREKTATDNEVNDMIKLKTDQEAHLKKKFKSSND